jgi:hypothetical protein
MNTIKLLCTLILSTCFVTPAVGESAVAGYAEGKTFYYSFIPVGPEWKDHEEHPPLSPRKAENLAKSKLAVLLKEPDKWVLRDIQLTKDSQDQWFYVVVFYQRNAHGVQSGMRVPVLMDGTTPEPKVHDDKTSSKGSTSRSPNTTPEENQQSEQAGTGQPATAPQLKSEGSDKPQPQSEGRSR